MNRAAKSKTDREIRKLVETSTVDGTSADLAYAVLKLAINNGVLAPGERIFANELAETMGVSRTPVREALRKLEAQSIIEMHPRNGLVVRDVTEQELLHVYAIREALEGTAARQAAENMSQYDLAELRSLVGRLQAAADAADEENFRTLILAIHRTLARASRNERLLKMIEELHDVVVRMGASTLRVPGRIAIALDVHIRLLEALERRDGDAAEDIVRKYRRSTFETRLAQYYAAQIPGHTPPSE